MYDDIIYGFKLIVFLIALACICKGSKLGGVNNMHTFYSGVVLFMFSLFMTGVEMFTPGDSPWEYLIISGNEDDWFKSLLGGTLLMCLPLMVLASCGDIEGILKTKGKSNG
ncbi:hypothetical protein [Vibrio europaeus]|uniref:Uncharacterized protein n=1 Tax=Vibrio europaeus TaxID=300876 RepID=A0ABT5GR88_9VIBR|nr:hypothetical protein [Vibrio europaeus]MDC5725667.1 hypothetical protein [Vibrio europaeus]MDC5728269.1 hypothetical protein [Vibrio europaeus]MDC5734481.1 hypothetical protein [Vibrio europaeus]MDC5739762.1 hypothetical protein [Vibrio europaeus]